MNEKRTLSGSLVLLFSFAGCTATTNLPQPPASPTPVSQQPSENPAPSSKEITSWKFIPTQEPIRYTSSVTTSIRQTDLVASKRDSLVVGMLYSLKTIRSADSLLFSGSISRHQVRSYLQSQDDTVQIMFPVSFSGSSKDHSIYLTVLKGSEPVASSTCNDPSQNLLPAVRRSLIRIPLELITDQRWSDSLSFAGCSNGVLVSTSSNSQFHVIGNTQLDGADVLAIEQNEETLSKGEGSQGQHRIAIEATGQVSRILLIDKTSGLLLNSKGTGKTIVTVTTSGTAHHFEEISTEVLERFR